MDTQMNGEGPIARLEITALTFVCLGSPGELGAVGVALEEQSRREIRAGAAPENARALGSECPESRSRFEVWPCSVQGWIQASYISCSLSVTSHDSCELPRLLL